MKDIPRLAPDLPLPEYIFIPGENPHPKKIGGHMEGERDPVADKINPSLPGRSQTLRYAIDLYNYGYFWESHVYFEALWNAHGRQGDLADMLKAFIKLGAAALKKKLGQTENSHDHFARANELITQIKSNQGASFLGFDLQSLLEDCEKKKNSLLIPDWD